MPGLSEGKYKRVVGSVSVGCTPKRLKEEVQTMIFKFHDFVNLERDEEIISPSVRGFGYEWSLGLYPGGDENSSETIEYISCYINHDVEGTVFAACNFRCKGGSATFPEIHPFTSDGGHGFPDFLPRKDVLEYYLDEDGTLVIEVDMQIAVDKENDDVWYPKLNIPNNMLTQIYHSSFEDDTNTSDVVFDVDGIEFHGHKSIFCVRTRTIFELIKDNNNTNNDGVVVVPIPKMESSRYIRRCFEIYLLC